MRYSLAFCMHCTCTRSLALFRSRVTRICQSWKRFTILVKRNHANPQRDVCLFSWIFCFDFFDCLDSSHGVASWSGCFGLPTAEVGQSQGSSVEDITTYNSQRCHTSTLKGLECLESSAIKQLGRNSTRTFMQMFGHGFWQIFVMAVILIYFTANLPQFTEDSGIPMGIYVCILNSGAHTL